MASFEKRLYVSLDSLLDTRQGTLTTLDLDFSLDITTNEKYFNRQVDDFFTDNIKLDKDLFIKINKSGDSRVLNNSVKTRMLFFLVQLLNELIKQNNSTPFKTAKEIDINVFPYSLTDEESKVFLDIISKQIQNMFTVNLINIPDNKLSIEYVSANYKAMIMYYYHDWLNLYNEKLKQNTLKDTALYVPKIFFGNLPTKKDYEELAKLGKDPFEMSQYILSPILPIEYLPVSLYCIDTPNNKHEFNMI